MAAKRRRSLETDNLTSLGVSADGEILDDWETIIKIAQAGRAADFYSSGNTKQLEWGSGGIVNMILVGINEDDRSDNKGKANMTFVPDKSLWFKSPVGDSASSHSISSAEEGDYRSTVVCWAAEGLMNLLPEYLQKAILSVRKSCVWRNINAVYLTSTHDFKIWIPSCRELGVNMLGSPIEDTGPVYSNIPTYFQGQNFTNAGLVLTRSMDLSSKLACFKDKTSSVVSETKGSAYILPCFCI